MNSKLLPSQDRSFCAFAPLIAFLKISLTRAEAASDFTDANWISMGGIPGANGTVFAAAVDSSGNLYIGGDFTIVGDTFATNIAKWDGSSWSALGPGVSGPVYAIAVSGNGVYAGGGFTNAGGSAANGIAKWNGSNWSALGSGVNNIVRALAVSGSNVYAGGVFSMAGGNSANNIAKWDGSSWSALGSGLRGRDLYGSITYVYGLEVSGSDLYAGGEFTTAGQKVSVHLAKAIVNPPILAIEPDGFGGYFINFSGVPGSAYRLQRAQTIKGPWAATAPQTAPASGLVAFWDLFPPPGQGFYRSVQP